ncbi:MAG: hypothetical protein IPJ40_14835 [Saprospirales bacterium]|nr:hypothetical protein [Saprospirales bacterium]
MAKPKLIFYCRHWKKELEDLFQYLHMPLVNTNDSVRRLLAILTPLHPEFREADFEKEKVHRILFPNLEYNERRIRNLFSDLTLKVVQYYSWRAFSREEEIQQLLLIKEFQARDLIELTFRTGNRYLDDFQAQAGVSAAQQWLRFQLQDLLFEADDSKDRYLEGAQDDLDQFFMLSKLRLSALQVSRKVICRDPGKSIFGRNK